MRQTEEIMVEIEAEWLKYKKKAFKQNIFHSRET